MQEAKNSVPKSEQVPSIDQTVRQSIFDGQPVSREDIRNGLQRDLRGLHVTLTDVLRSKECIDALTDVYYQRYLAIISVVKSEDSVPSSDEVETQS